MTASDSCQTGKKICIGTAAFGLDYGITNQQGKASLPDIEKILARALQSGVHQIDTAQAYGDAEDRLGQIGIKDFQVITKTSPPRDNIQLGKWSISKSLELSLRRLKLDSCHGFLLHDTAFLHAEGADELANQMHKMKFEKKVSHIGFSSYDATEAELLCERHEFDMVQLPFNLLDQRAGESGALARLKKRGVYVSVRSVFLQGILLSLPRSTQQNANLPLEAVQKFHQGCQKHNVTPLRAALGFVLQEKDISSIVLGCASLKEWEEILFALKEPRVNIAWSLQSNFQREMLDPRTWQIGSPSATSAK
jgi:aryl-alcohol dehydrogenase-like predicted oxidoreductase